MEGGQSQQHLWLGVRAKALSDHIVAALQEGGEVSSGSHGDRAPAKVCVHRAQHGGPIVGHEHHQLPVPRGEPPTWMYRYSNAAGSRRSSSTGSLGKKLTRKRHLMPW